MVEMKPKNQSNEDTESIALSLLIWKPQDFSGKSGLRTPHQRVVSILVRLIFFRKLLTLQNLQWPFFSIRVKFYGSRKL